MRGSRCQQPGRHAVIPSLDAEILITSMLPPGLSSYWVCNGSPLPVRLQVTRQLLPLLSTLGSDRDAAACRASIAAASVIFGCLGGEQEVQEALFCECRNGRQGPVASMQACSDEQPAALLVPRSATRSCCRSRLDFLPSVAGQAMPPTPFAATLDDMLIAGGHTAEMALLAVLAPLAPRASSQQLEWLLQRLLLMLAAMHQRGSSGELAGAEWSTGLLLCCHRAGQHASALPSL